MPTVASLSPGRWLRPDAPANTSLAWHAPSLGKQFSALRVTKAG
jgi:hypothetical protein